MQALAQLVLLVLAATAVGGMVAVVALVARAGRLERPGARRPPSPRSGAGSGTRHDAAPLRRLPRAPDRRGRRARDPRLPLAAVPRAHRPAGGAGRLGAGPRPRPRAASMTWGSTWRGSSSSCARSWERGPTSSRRRSFAGSAASTTPCRRSRSPRSAAPSRRELGRPARRRRSPPSTRRRSPPRRWRRCTARRCATARRSRSRCSTRRSRTSRGSTSGASAWRARFAGGLLRHFDLRSIVEEIAAMVALELDFAREAASTERIRAALADDPTVRVPRLHPDYTTGRLLVLEFLDGIKVTDLDALAGAGHALPAVAQRIGRVYARMIFEHGFFQGDPHPGNLLVLPGTVIGLLDFGLAKELPAGFGDAVAELLTRGLAGDVPGAAAAARRAGFEMRDDQATALPRARAGAARRPRRDAERGSTHRRDADHPHPERIRTRRAHAAAPERTVAPAGAGPAAGATGAGRDADAARPRRGRARRPRRRTAARPRRAAALPGAAMGAVATAVHGGVRAALRRPLHAAPAVGAPHRLLQPSRGREGDLHGRRGRPARRRGQRPARAHPGPALAAAAGRPRTPPRAPALAAALPRRPHARLRPRDAGHRRRGDRALAARPALPDPRRDAGRDARRDLTHRLRARRGTDQARSPRRAPRAARGRVQPADAARRAGRRGAVRRGGTVPRSPGPHRPLAVRRDRRPPPGRRDGPVRHSLAAGRRPLRRRRTARGPGAARRADDDAVGGPRDHRHRPRVGGEPRDRASRGAGPPVRPSWRRELPRRATPSARCGSTTSTRSAARRSG